MTLEIKYQWFLRDEIADKLGISVNTVKVQKNKSIKYLRDRLIHCRRELKLVSGVLEYILHGVKFMISLRKCLVNTK